MKVKVVPTDLTKSMYFVEVNDNNKYNELRKLIGGGWIEQVRLGRFAGTYKFRDQEQIVPPDGSLVMLVDEEGLLKGLSLNARASALYGVAQHGQPICGDAVLLGEVQTNEGPDWGPYALED